MRRLPNGARWREVPHGADRALWIRARDLPELIAGCVLAVTDFSWGIGTLRPEETLAVNLGDGADPEGAIFRALAEALFLADARGLLAAQAFVEADGSGVLRLVMRCDRLDPARHRRRRVVKAPTFHGMLLRRDRFGVGVRLVLDV